MAQRKTSSTKASAPKKPADHLLSFDDLEGSELLVSISSVKGSDQMRLLGKLTELGLLDDKASSDLEIEDLDFEKLADLVDYVSEKFAKSPQAFDDFTRGKGGFERALNLVTAYAGALGE